MSESHIFFSAKIRNNIMNQSNLDWPIISSAKDIEVPPYFIQFGDLSSSVLAINRGLHCCRMSISSSIAYFHALIKTCQIIDCYSPSRASGSLHA